MVILSGKGYVRFFIILDFNLYYRDIVILLLWYYNKISYKIIEQKGVVINQYIW